MTDYILAIFFGIIQGVTELLPISSSGHLLALHEFFDLSLGDQLAFDVFLHLATMLAVLLYFRQDLWRMFKALPQVFKSDAGPDARSARNLAIATVPAALAGYFGSDIIENSLRSAWIVVFMLAAVGFLFIWMEKKHPGKRSAEAMGAKQAILIGLAQVLALIPGTSRSGITILAALGLGYGRADAARFSFLLSVPVIAGAVLLKAPAVLSELSDGYGLWLIASLAAFLSAWASIRFLLGFLRRHTFSVFGYYRIGLALALALLLFFR